MVRLLGSFGVLLVAALAAPQSAHALGSWTGCNDQRIVRGWAPSLQPTLSRAAEHCVSSYWHNGGDFVWQAGPSELLVAQVSELHARLAGPEIRRWRPGPLALVRLHSGRPTVRGLGERHPHLEADWKLGARGIIPPDAVPDDDSDGAWASGGFRSPPGGHVLASFTVDVWLWRLDRADLVFPQGVVVEEVTRVQPTAP